MDASLTPRQIAKNLLNGEAPPRPLLLPMVFSLGARVANVPLSAFLTNPTKIVNAARQIRNHLEAKVGELPRGLRSPEEAARSGRIPVAAEVIRRMNAVPSREYLLMASVTGPLALAALLMQSEKKESGNEVANEVLEFAGFEIERGQGAGERPELWSKI